MFMFLQNVIMKKRQMYILIFVIIINVFVIIYLLRKDKLKINYIADKLLTRGEYPKRDISNVDRLIVHHSACCCHDNCNAEMYAVVHVNERGWAGIGYHFVIEKDGELYQTNDLDRMSTHTQGNNARGIGICLTGDFTREKLPDNMKSKLIQTLKYFRRNYGIKEVWKHRDFHTTGCPGISDNEFLEVIKKAGFKPEEYYNQ